MVPANGLIEKVKSLLWAKGEKSLETAKQLILQEKMEFEPLQEALRYFMEEFWEDVLHPALLVIACEAVGGNPDATTHIGAAIVLLAGGADVHDDIIDQSRIKDTKPTVFGKFGKDLAVLVGDALLFKGLYLLHEACEPLPQNQKKQILELVKQAFFNIGNAEATETGLRGSYDFSPEEYLDIIRTKVSVAEVMMKIGAILGGGTQEEIEAYGHYGKTLGILLTIRDEFIDIFELDELKNRIEKECLPLPIIAALQDSDKRDELISLLKKEEITQNEVEEILDLVMNSKGARGLKEMMGILVKEEIQRFNPDQRFREPINLLLKCSLVEL
jgi:geranylgeranyl diphosphate synthase type I